MGGGGSARLGNLQGGTRSKLPTFGNQLVLTQLFISAVFILLTAPSPSLTRGLPNLFTCTVRGKSVSQGKGFHCSNILMSLAAPRLGSDRK